MQGGAVALALPSIDYAELVHSIWALKIVLICNRQYTININIRNINMYMYMCAEHIYTYIYMWFGTVQYSTVQ